MQATHATHEREGPVGQQPDAQAVVDHAAHGVQARDLDALAQRPAGLRSRLAHGQADAAVGLQADDVPLHDFVEAQRAAVREGVALGHHHHQPVASVQTRVQAVQHGSGAGVAQAQVGSAFAHGVQHVGAEMLLQVDLDLRMLRGKRTKVFRQELHDGRDVGVHAHMAAHAVGIFAELALHALQPEQHGTRVVQQAFTGGRERDAAAVPVEQGGVHCRFQIGQALADGRCGDELALRRTPDAAQFAHGHEQLQRRQIDTARKTALGAFHGGRGAVLLVWRGFWLFSPMSMGYVIVKCDVAHRVRDISTRAAWVSSCSIASKRGAPWA